MVEILELATSVADDGAGIKTTSVAKEYRHTITDRYFSTCFPELTLPQMYRIWEVSNFFEYWTQITPKYSEGDLMLYSW